MKGLVVLLAVVVVAGGLGALMESMDDFGREELDEDFSVTTGVGETSANVVLAENLWDTSVAYATPSSNESADAPTASSYSDSNRTLTVAGLAASTTRTLTVTYFTNRLDKYEGAETGKSYLPTAIILGLVLVAFFVVINAIRGR